MPGNSSRVSLLATFTTEPHGYIRRGNKTVRARCIEFVETLRLQQIKQLTVEHARDTFSQIIDHWDNATLDKYFGVQPHVTKQESETRNRYSNDNVSIKRSERTLHLPMRKGYLEKLGLVHYEKRGKTWFLVLSESGPIIPELVKAPKCVGGSNDNFYFSPKDASNNCSIDASRKNGEDSMARSAQGLQLVVEKRRERVSGARNINRSSESEAYSEHNNMLDEQGELTLEERMILSIATRAPQKIERAHTQNEMGAS